MLVFYIINDFETFYFCGRNSDGTPILSVNIDDCMHFNFCEYGFLKHMHDEGFKIMWGD